MCKCFNVANICLCQTQYTAVNVDFEVWQLARFIVTAKDTYDIGLIILALWHVPHLHASTYGDDSTRAKIVNILPREDRVVALILEREMLDAIDDLREGSVAFTEASHRMSTIGSRRY